MSTNEVMTGPGWITVLLPVPLGYVSGDPVIVGGNIRGVLETDRDGDGNASVRMPYTLIYKFSVKGENGAGNTAIAQGGLLYWETAATPKLSADSTNGTLYGIAMEAVASGATEEIEVAILQGA